MAHLMALVCNVSLETFDRGAWEALSEWLDDLLEEKKIGLTNCDDKDSIGRVDQN